MKKRTVPARFFYTHNLTPAYLESLLFGSLPIGSVIRFVSIKANVFPCLYDKSSSLRCVVKNLPAALRLRVFFQKTGCVETLTFSRLYETKRPTRRKDASKKSRIQEKQENMKLQLPHLKNPHQTEKINK